MTWSASNNSVQFQHPGLDHQIKIVSGGLQMGWALEDSVKEKIWNDQYIDLGELLEQGGQTNYAVSVDPESGSAFIFTKYKRAIKNIKEWDKAFATFVSVYLQKTDNIKHWAHLITYVNEIKSMAEDGLNFLDYNETFHRVGCNKDDYGMKVPWDWNVFCQDLFNRIHLKALIYKFNFNNNNTNRKLQFEPRAPGTTAPPCLPMGYCFDYHSFGK